jgi:hypothetical protein
MKLFLIEIERFYTDAQDTLKWAAFLTLVAGHTGDARLIMLANHCLATTIARSIKIERMLGQVDTGLRNEDLEK